MILAARRSDRPGLAMGRTARSIFPTTCTGGSGASPTRAIRRRRRSRRRRTPPSPRPQRLRLSRPKGCIRRRPRRPDAAPVPPGATRAAGRARRPHLPRRGQQRHLQRLSWLGRRRHLGRAPSQQRHLGLGRWQPAGDRQDDHNGRAAARGTTRASCRRRAARSFRTRCRRRRRLCLGGRARELTIYHNDRQDLPCALTRKASGYPRRGTDDAFACLQSAALLC